jgi:hypothetical protein
VPFRIADSSAARGHGDGHRRCIVTLMIRQRRNHDAFKSGPVL